jgi:hypothetical protein
MKWIVPIPADKPDPMTVDLSLTDSEKSKVATFKCALEDNRRRQNEADTLRQQQIDAAEAARLGVVWEGE